MVVPKMHDVQVKRASTQFIHCLVSPLIAGKKFTSLLFMASINCIKGLNCGMDWNKRQDVFNYHGLCLGTSMLFRIKGTGLEDKKCL